MHKKREARFMSNVKIVLTGMLTLFLIQLSCNVTNQVVPDGGRCTYVKYEGKAKIKSIAPAPVAEYNCPENPMQILFEFTPDTITDRQKYKFDNYNDTACYMRINDGANPSNKWIAFNKVEIGKVFKCFRMEQALGTCTPVIFEFPDINLFPEDGCR
jgi:hypothetical protein